MSAEREDIVRAASQAPIAGSPVQLHKALHAIWRTQRGWGRLAAVNHTCLLYTSPSPRDRQKSRMPSSA